MRAGLEVAATGPLALVEDLGRPGRAALGVSPSGAADRSSLRFANRLLANPEGAAAIEVTLGGLEVVARGRDLWVAVTGAPTPLRVGGTLSGHSGVLLVHDGDSLVLGTPACGLRTYVAVRGGLEVPTTLGSRSCDVLSGLGPDPLAAGDMLPVGTAEGDLPSVDFVPEQVAHDRVVLRVVRGPRDGWVGDADALVRTPWVVSSHSNRVGIRLDGGRLGYADGDQPQLPSEGVLRGAIQVPPGGQPVLFLADHPVTGGYPVVGVVVDDDVDRAAQVRPGQGLRLRWTE